MKKLILFTAVVIVLFAAKATDLVVQENGPVGTYSNIPSAVAAAVDGDRILINNKVGDVPWLDDVTINKSLEFLSAVDSIRFIVKGDYTIVSASDRVVSFVGMENITGDIKATADASGNRTTVNIMSCKLTNGDIDFNYNNYNVNVISNILSYGKVSIRFGKVIGNEVSFSSTGNPIYIASDATATEDTIQVIANIVIGSSNGIYWNSISQYLYFANNYVRFSSSSYPEGIYVQNVKNSSAGVNTIVNNSFYSSTTSTTTKAGLYFSVSIPALVRLNIYNNVFETNTTSGFRGISFGTTPNGTLNVGFNYSNYFVLSGFGNDGTNVNISTVGIHTTTGVNDIGSPAIDGGHLLPEYNDIDLSRNDAGCYGGSFTLDNFHPIDAGSARVYIVNTPRRVFVGNTMNVEAGTFDK